MNMFMSLKEALGMIVQASDPVFLRAAGVDWEAQVLLNELPDRKLGQQVQYMPGFYIAAVNDAHCLGEVLYRIKKKA